MHRLEENASALLHAMCTDLIVSFGVVVVLPMCCSGCTHRLYNNLALASELPLGGNYSLFKDGIQPAWEDAQNEKGGKWTITLHPKNQGGIDELWLNTVSVHTIR